MSLIYQQLGELVIAADDHRSFTDQQWEGFVETCRRSLLKHGHLRLLIINGGGNGPNAGQRKYITSTLKSGSASVAILSDSYVIRGVVTAFKWLTPAGKLSIAAFPSKDENAAMAHLKIPEADRAEVSIMLQRCHAAATETSASA